MLFERFINSEPTARGKARPCPPARPCGSRDPGATARALARDFIRLVQVARKDAGFNVSDRIAIEVKAGPTAAAAIDAHLDAVKHETLAVSLGKAGAPAGTVSEGKLGDEPISIGVRVAS